MSAPADPRTRGPYAWDVVRQGDRALDRATSAKRTFTVQGPRLTKLRVTTREHRGTRSKYPGYTVLTARTTAYARVRVVLCRSGRRNPYYLRADKSGRAALRVSWSCQRPGRSYRAAVQASDQYGKNLRSSVSFKPISRNRCDSMRAREEAARRSRERERAAQEREDARRAAQQDAARIRRFTNNCLAINGIPRPIQRSDGPYIVCVSPYGGLLSVP